MIDKFIKHSSLLGGLMVFLGVLKLTIYYSAFDINIIEFLTFSEIITTFLDDINLLLIFGLAMVIQTVPLLNYIQKKSGLSKSKFSEAWDTIVYSHRYSYIAFFVLVIAIISWLIYTNRIQLNYWIIYFLLVFIIQALTYLGLHKDQKGKIDILNSAKALTMVVAGTSAIFLLAQYDIQEVKTKYQTVEIASINSLIVCSTETNKTYLGKTDNYLFIRDIYKNSTICIPTSEIKGIEFSSLNK